MAFIVHAIQVIIIGALIVAFGSQIIRDTKLIYRMIKGDKKNGEDN